METRRYAILVGNAAFPKDKENLDTLRCPLNDVKGLGDLLASEQYGAYTVTPILDSSHDVALRTIYQCLKEAKREDLVLIYYSGHGKLDEDGNLYLVTNDTVTNILPPTSIPIDDIKKYMQASLASVVIVLDCCYSGAVKKLYKGVIQDQASSAIRRLEGRGIFFLTASTDTQLAEEKETDEYSLLTKYIIEGIRDGVADADDDGKVSFQEMCSFVQERVANEGKQRPRKWALDVEGEVTIALTGKPAWDKRRQAVIKKLYEMGTKESLSDDRVRELLEIINPASTDNIRAKNKATEHINRLNARLSNDSLFVEEAIRLSFEAKLAGGATSSDTVTDARRTEPAEDETPQRKHKHAFGVKVGAHDDAQEKSIVHEPLNLSETSTDDQLEVEAPPKISPAVWKSYRLPGTEKVFEEELEQVETSRRLRLSENPQRPPAEQSLIGLALSGGGARSATFNLGILQGLAQLGLLRKFDYLSTVSGGGYIGSWLMAWMHHQNIGIKDVEKKLAPAAYEPQNVTEASEVRFLRNYSNYLTPRTGLLSADFWAFLASYLRNTLSNLIILLLALLSLLLLPRSIVYLPHFLDRFDDWGYGLAWLTAKTPTESGFAQYWALVVGLAFGLFGVVGMGLNLCWVNPAKGLKIHWIARPWAIQAFILVPLFLSAALFSYGLDQIFRYDVPQDYLFVWTMSIGLGAYGCFWMLACLARWLARLLVWRSCDCGPAAWVILPTAILAGALGGLLLLPYAMSVNGQTTPHAVIGVWKVLTFGAPGLIGFMLVTGTLHIGLMGRKFLDVYREWGARLGGWLAVYACGWVLLFVLVAYMPAWLNAFVVQEYAKHRYRFTVGSVLLWAASTAYGVLFGRSSATGQPIPHAPLKKKIPRWAAWATPYIFFVGLLVGLSVVSAWVAAKFYGEPFKFSAASDYVNFKVACVWIGFAGVALLLSWRVDINEVSVHGFYRNRLARAYLGASVLGFNDQRAAGYSESGDFPLAKLTIPHGSVDAKDGRPFPILNTSLISPSGTKSAWQSDKMRSFAFTPLYSGFTRRSYSSNEWESAYALTEVLGSQSPESAARATLGTALAISGAVSSPVALYHSSRPLAFLMKLFDARLGWWIGNPTQMLSWKRGSPTIGFAWLLRELVGSTDDRSAYFVLSDGGLFENLGIYELVRRRCRIIVASDVSCDLGYSFDDLHNAIERCRIDFGVQIVVDTSALVPDQTRGARAHFALGRIHYIPNSPECDGVLIYLKPSLVAYDPPEVLGHSRKNPLFPHDAAANNSFDESHFENYRALGQIVGIAADEAISSALRHLIGSTKGVGINSEKFV